ncbi:Transducin beta protein 3 [Phytophthora nicotianae]|uniref:Transducin beta protein 3 n=1 Tax=Phytophthora nicotianae TaxID=4792 RepID=A0A0W8D7K4_PHYNI|nr:Transducin beta protein 3 [Phytophthora nicotianae]
MSFPASKYSRYKRATAFFLDWLLRARGRGRFAGKRLDLNAFDAVVEDIAQDPTTLTPKLLQDLPKALGAGQCAITLRQHVALFFDDQERGHRHFLALLRRWVDTLKSIEVAQELPVEREIRRFENYYQVLQVDEDYFPDEETFIKDKGASKKSKAERKKLFDEAFAQDLQMEVVCYFMELEELVEGVFSIYDQVKKQEKTMMEATVVGTLALHMANQLTAKLQLRYPTLKLAEDLVGVLQCMAHFIRLHDAIPPIEPIEKAHLIALPDGYFGPNYGEERTPEYVLPDTNHFVVLLAQQLPLLYTEIARKIAVMGRGYEGQSGLVVDFMNAMEEYLATRQVTIQLVFLCICWMQSVTALQGDAGLTRTIGLTIKHTEDLIQVVKTSLPKHSVLASRDSLHAIIEDIMNGFHSSLLQNDLARANPLFAGSQMMSNHLEYLLIGGGDFSTCRAFCQLYNALVQQGFLERIPFFDEMLDIYEEMIFNPSSRATAVHGSYHRVYLLASNWSGSSIDATYASASATGKHVRERMKTADRNMASLTYRLMHDDMSFLKGASSKEMLKKAADVCSKEMFETRILSRDLLTLNDDLVDAFSDMCDALGRQEIRDEFIAKALKHRPHDVKVRDAVEHSVMVPLLALMDALRSDGSVDSNAVPASIRATVEFIVDGSFIQRSCEAVAAIIKARFATPSQVCEQKYFTFPAGPDFVNREYGSVSFKTKSENENREQIFSDLMRLMKSSRGPLTGRNLSVLKAEIKKDPLLLGMFSRGSEFNPDTEDNHCTLLHQAAVGPARDAKLLEWLIHMGALFNQPLHCRKEPRQRDLTCPRKLLPNTMAIHSATIAGYSQMVKLLLEWDIMVDLNTPTYHTKETLAHLAVKHGHRELYYGLQGYGADVRIKDGSGRRVCEVTTDRKLAEEIAVIEARIELTSSMGRGRRERPGLFQQGLTRLAEHSRKSLFAQRDGERQRALDDLTTSAPMRSKRKKKSKKEAKDDAGMTAGDAATSLTAATGSPLSVVTEAGTSPTAAVIAALLGIGSSDEKRDTTVQDSLQHTMAAFTRLRDPNIASVDKVQDVQHVCKVIQRLDDAAEVQADANKIINTGVQLRVDISYEATQVIHMIQKFYRMDHAGEPDAVLAPVRELCATTIDFVKFVVRTARISVSVGRKAQASEVLAALEKRLLKTPLSEREPPNFREMVQTYSKERDFVGLGRTSSPDALRRLEWYLKDVVENHKLLMTLDRIAGCPYYFKLAIASATSEQQLDHFRTAINGLAALNGVACFRDRGWCVVYGGASKDDVATARDLVSKVATIQDIQLTSRARSSAPRPPNWTLPVLGWRILRNAEAA